jgi:hypothetical protein
MMGTGEGTRPAGARGRSAIDLTYLAALEAQLDAVLEGEWLRKVPILRIDSATRDFRVGGAERNAIAAECRLALERCIA